MTFVCAQAFDMNFRLWQANREAAKKDALASEKDDIGEFFLVIAGIRVCSFLVWSKNHMENMGDTVKQQT